MKAQNERQAFIQGNGYTPTFYMYNCSYWIIEGIRAEGADNPNFGGSPPYVFRVNKSNHITMRRLLAAHNNRYANSHTIGVTYSSYVLIEESEAYYFHRHGISVFESDDVTIRRCYVNSRGYADIPGGYASHSNVRDRGDEGITLYYSTDSIVENSISEGNEGIESSGQRNKFYGDISINNYFGFAFIFNCSASSLSGCGTTMQEKDDYGENLVSIGASRVGFFFSTSQNGVIKNVTIIGSNGNAGISANNRVPDVNASFYVTNALSLNNATVGFYVDRNQRDWQVSYVNAFKNTKGNFYTAKRQSDELSLNSSWKNKKEIDPRLGSCYVYIPSTSPMRRAGKNGADIGANIIYRYENGRLTSEKLWNQITGQFTCGTTVIGVNDDVNFPDSSCVNVHKRLNVGVNGCAIP